MLKKTSTVVLFYRCFRTVVYFMADDNIGASHNKTKYFTRSKTI